MPAEDASRPRHWRAWSGKAKLLGLDESKFPCAPVAQLDRALASGARGREFESPWARHLKFFIINGLAPLRRQLCEPEKAGV
jgi:hypothetical protein